MTTAGPNACSTGANTARGGSVRSWTGPTNIYVSNDGNVASVTFSGAGYTDYLYAQGFGFSIPSGATINGITVSVRRQDGTGGTVVDDSVVIIKGGSLAGTDQSAGASWPDSYTVDTFGGASSLWGTTWTPADINSSSFGVAFACSTPGYDSAFIDYCEITIDYTAGAPPGAYSAQTKAFGLNGELLSMLKNTAGQKIGGQMITASDGSNFTGSVTVYITGDAGTQAAGTVGSGACTHEGKGYHTYAPSQAETNYDLIGFTFEGTGAITNTVQVATQSASSVLDAAGVRSAIGLASANLDTQLAAIDDLIDTEVGAIKTKTDQLTFTVANQVDANTLSGGGTGLSSDITAIKAKTDNLPSDSADASVVAGLIAAVETKVDTIDTVVDAIKVKSDQLTFTVANKVDSTATLSAADSMVLSSGTATAGGNKTITLQTALGADNMGIGCKIKITSGTGSLQMRRVAGYVNSTKVLTVDRAWTTNPDNTSVYAVVYDSDVGATVCRYGAAFTSSAGTTLKISAWLERDGQAVVLASGSCTVTYRENASGTDLFTVTDSAPNAQGIFELSQTSPGFTSDRLQIASVEITVGNDTWITREPAPIFG